MGPHSGPGSNTQQGPTYPSSWQDAGTVEQHMSMLGVADSISAYDIRHTFDATGLAGHHLQGDEDASGHRGSGATQQFSFLSGPSLYQSSEDDVAAMPGRDAGQQLEEQDAANAYFFREHTMATQQLLYSRNNFLPTGYSHQGGPEQGLGVEAGRGPHQEWADGVASANLDASRMLELQYHREQLGAGGSPPRGDEDPGLPEGFRFGDQYSHSQEVEASGSGHGGDGSGAFRGYDGGHNGGAQLHAPAGNDNYDDELASQAYRISLLQQQHKDHSQLHKTHVSVTCEMQLAMQQQAGDHGPETVHTPGSLLFASQQQQEVEGMAMGSADSRATGWSNLWLFNGNGAGAGASFYNGPASYDSVQDLSAFGSSNVNSVPSSSASAAAVALGSGTGSLHAQGFSSDTAMHLYLTAYNDQGFADASGGVSDLMVASGSGGAGNPDFGMGGSGSGSGSGSQGQGHGHGHGGSQSSYLNLPLQASAMGQGNAGLGMQVHHLSALDDTASQHLSLATNMQLGQGASPFTYTTSSGSWRHESTELTFLPSSESAQESSHCFQSVAEQLSHFDVLQRSRAQSQHQQRSAFQGRLSMADSDAVQGSGQGLSLSLFSQQQQQQQSNVQGGRSSLDAPGHGQLAAVGPTDVMSLAAAAEARLSLHDHAGPSNPGLNPSLSRFRTPAPPHAREPFPVLRHIVHNSSGPQQVYRQVDVEAAPLGRLLTSRGTYARAGRELLHEICSPSTSRPRGNAHRRAAAHQREPPAAAAASAALQPSVVQPAAPQAAVVEAGAVGDSAAECDARVQQGESSNGPVPPPQPPVLTPEQRSQIEAKKARLTGMMEELDNMYHRASSAYTEVDGTYRAYSEQMRVVITTMDVALGRGAAQSYTNLAFEAMSRHFRGLRDTIEGQLRICNRLLGEEDAPTLSLSRGEIPRLRFVDQQLRQQRALQHLGMLQQHAWRPQRGLPERAVTVLRAWLFEHFLHPYPKDGDKMSLARQTGLTRSQVSNWFINARVRLWKPMVEEMYLEESKEEEAAEQRAAALALEEAPVAPEGESPIEETMASGSEGPEVQDEDGRARKKARNGPAPGQEEMSGSGSALPTLGPFQGLSRFVTGASSRFVPGASGGSGSVVSLTLGLRHSDVVSGSQQGFQLPGLELVVAGSGADEPTNVGGPSFGG